MLMDPLAAWVLEYLRNKDIVKQSITGIKELNDYSFIVEQRTKRTLVYVAASIENLDSILSEISGMADDMHPMIATLNTASNIAAITRNFKKLSEFHKMLQLLVFNPDSSTDKKWTIFPWTHMRIADPETLSQGIKAMSETFRRCPRMGTHAFR